MYSRVLHTKQWGWRLTWKRKIMIQLPRKKEKGLMGIGTLIVFIAIILVAAVASTVVITTGGSLQQKALITGVQTEEGIASGAEAIAVLATDASDTDATPKSVENFEILMRLQAGSEGINLNSTILTLDTQSLALTYNYGNVSTGLCYDTSHFIVEYLQEGPVKEDGYLNRGDVIKVKFCTATNITGSWSGTSITENERVRVNFIPRVGTLTMVEIATPDTMVGQRVMLWPTG
ncbi:MAG: hypothetical protein GF334_06815 [Candidatus Altiarchaeales archaeon]|nr:hypothetical protein [Candidatus Altiarchaeales archaeon]